MLERVTKEYNLGLYRAYGGAAIRKRIVAFFFCTHFQHLKQLRARSPPLSDLISQKLKSEVKKGDF